MHYRSIFALAALICILVGHNSAVASDLLPVSATLARGPPLLKTNWNILSSNATTDGYSYPRVASFSSGNYVVIYGYSGQIANGTTSSIVQKFNPITGEAITLEYKYQIEVGVLTAQNIQVFSDNTAMGIWQSKGQFSGVYLTDEANRTASLYYRTINITLTQYTTDYLDLVGGGWLYFAIGYSGPADSVNFVYNNKEFSVASNAIIHSAVSRKVSGVNNPVFVFIVHSMVDLPQGYFTVQKFTPSTTVYAANDDTLENATRAIPFVLDDLDIVAGFFVTTDGRIHLVAFDTTDVNGLYDAPIARNADSNFTPSVLQMSNNTVLVAFSSASRRIHYQMVKLSQTSAVLVGPQVAHDAAMTTLSVSMANTIGSDIVVVAKDVTGTQIMSRTITFCGNNALDLKEECDGSQGCTSDCKCQMGTIAVNGACVDQCQNGIVTGQEQCDSGTGCVECKCASGYRPTTPRSQSCEVVPKEFVPNVKPQFNCLETSSSIYTLHFSYINSDGFDETVSYGALNSFTPASLGANRPSIFSAGQSLTYPLSPYSVDVPSDTQSVTWILTSYNLTVDLTNSKSLECPKSLSIELTISTFGNLTDDLVHQLLQNIASKYNISESRLNASYALVSTDPQGLNTFVVVVTIIDSSTTTSEQSSAGVVKELLDDLQTSKEETSSELTKGLEQVNPVIKTVAPSIIEPRGTTTPISAFTPSGLTSQSSTKIVLITIILLSITNVL